MLNACMSLYLLHRTYDPFIITFGYAIGMYYNLYL